MGARKGSWFVLYLLIILFAAVAGAIRLWMLQRQEQKLEVAEDFRYNLQRLATQPLASSDLPEEGRFRAARRERKAARLEASDAGDDFFAEEFEPEKDPRYSYLGNRRLWRKPREPWFVTYTRTPAVVEELSGPRRDAGWAIDAFWREPAPAVDVGVQSPAPSRQPRHLPPFEGVRPQGRRASLEQHRRDAAKRRIELRRTGQVRA